MARTYEKLNTLKCRRLTTPGLYGDGGGLYLRIGPTGAKSWIFRYRRGGKDHDVGLGSCRNHTLAEARERARRCRRQLDDGLDPLTEKRKTRQARSVSPPFKQCAAEFIAAHEAGWSAKHRKDVQNSLANYAYPVIGILPVSVIDTPAVLRVLSPVWNDKTVTLDRVRARIEAVLDSAKTRGYRDGENPARWKGHLEHTLAKKAKVAKVEHLAALPYAEMPAFMTKLRKEEDSAARALELAILTAGRSKELLGAKWSEMDLEARLWVVPAERMKGGREHRVPLSAPAMAVLRAMQAVRQNDFVFPGPRNGQTLHERSMLTVLTKLAPGATVHGTARSSFTDWAVERTHFPAEARQLALAHAVGDKVEEAYRRSDMFARRRELAEAWSRYLDGTQGDVVALPLRAASS
jgi:integrase